MTYIIIAVVLFSAGLVASQSANERVKLISLVLMIVSLLTMMVWLVI